MVLASYSNLPPAKDVSCVINGKKQICGWTETDYNGGYDGLWINPATRKEELVVEGLRTRRAAAAALRKAYVKAYAKPNAKA